MTEERAAACPALFLASRTLDGIAAACAAYMLASMTEAGAAACPALFLAALTLDGIAAAGAT